MRLSAVVSEAARNVISGTTRAAGLTLLLALTVGGVSAADAASVDALIRSADAFQSSGSAVRILQEEGGIEGRTCDDVAGYGAVTSGAIRAAAPTRLVALPLTDLETYSVTPGLLAVLGGTSGRAGVWLSGLLAETLAARPGSVLLTDTGPMTVAGVFPYPDDGRDSRLSSAVLVPVPAEQRFDECWASAWPVSDSTDALLRFALAGDADPFGISTGQLNRRWGTAFDGPALFQNRVSRFAPLACAVLGVGIGFLSTRRRRLEYAAALHARQSRSAQIATMLLETLYWSVLGGMLAVAGPAATLWFAASSQVHETLAVAARGIPVAVACVLLGATAGLLPTRERLLFRYFKER